MISFQDHTPGCIGLLERKDEILFVGDSINAHLWRFLPEAMQLSDYIATLYKAKQLPFSKMVQAHNPIVESKDALEGYLETAENLDISKGVPYSNPLFPVEEAIMCVREGFDVMDFAKRGFASIVISREHLG